ncbi:hypothetical protein IVB45_33140 [Bradyrhizobium sp. 4]|uniref:hypothetical protein n=1 Tax=unclassified Bradyrhizobium TaxID=2631580 RepID=UPI001FF8B4F2|nr:MULTISPECIES: hypothetical protein [unclassified Bradyrhizobium]MCK1398504.1 hypothetical protein [Bradyrhizobium sp. 39]MCK1751748.1 hypothetical protein [Bradyrhizobium sp. 135]UPJ34706.1 hypothetical protein IVB45_33140 [Bradyrhizobium sp. 4]
MDSARRLRRMHASLVWSDLNAAAIIRGAVHLLHHVFLTILFGIFFVGCGSARAIVQSHVQGNAHWARPGHDRAQFARGKWWDGGYLPLVARITVGRGDFGVGTNAIVSRVVGFEMLRSPFGYIEAYAAGSCDCHCHCAKAGVAIAAEMATTATNSLDLIMIISPAWGDRIIVRPTWRESGVCGSAFPAGHHDPAKRP